MKLTSQVITQFEQDQINYGTQTALYNILWIIASDMMHDLGIKKISTFTKKTPNVRPPR